MEFGKRTAEEVDLVDWKLPPDDPVSVEFLNQLRSTGDDLPRHFIGAPAWGHREWAGKLYPYGAKATEFLYHYSRRFDCIELNTTHYRVPTPEQTQKWVSQVPEGFRFCAKVHKDISHSRTGLADLGKLAEWYAFLEKLGEHNGPCFMQLPPHFDYSMKALLFQFLKAWPSDFALALELRHPSWFEEGRVLPALTRFLQSLNIGLVITDVAGRRDVSHASVSAPFTMVRFVGNSLHPTDFTRAHAWSQRLLRWETQGLRDVFLFVHQPDDIMLPEMAKATIEIMNRDRGRLALAPLEEPVEEPKVQGDLLRDI